MVTDAKTKEMICAVVAAVVNVVIDNNEDEDDDDGVQGGLEMQKFTCDDF